nr:hypothetical protein [uncultured Lachnoclostridium sp.]
MSDVTANNLLQKSFKKEEVQHQKSKLDALKLRAKKNESVEISSVDKKDIIQLKNQWQELILDTEKLRTDYDMLIREMKIMKEVSLAIERGINLPDGLSSS